MFSLKDRVAIITGGGRGIGALFCKMFAEAGASIVVADIVEENAQTVARELEQAGHRALPVVVNVCNREHTEAMVTKALEAWGRVDILVNNAGITRDALLLRMTEQQ